MRPSDVWGFEMAGMETAYLGANAGEPAADPISGDNVCEKGTWVAGSCGKNATHKAMQTIRVRMDGHATQKRRTAPELGDHDDETD